MKKIIALFITALALISCKGPQPVGVSEIPLADPFILSYGGKYYAYGTGEPGFRTYISDDLKHWKRGGIALDTEKSWGTGRYWAPEVYYVDSKGLFYLFYSSDEHICVAVSNNPEGPFTQEEIKPIREENGIDASLFIDNDGKAYLYFVRFTGGNVIWVAEMDDSLTGIKEETLTECHRVSEPWENVDCKVAEGPSVFREGDTYCLLYSANHYRCKDYAIGYATASSPLGPWTPYEGNPIFKRGFPNAGNLVGIGHGAPFKDGKGRLMYVFHAHNSDSLIHPRLMYINTYLKAGKDGFLSMPGDVIAPELAE